MAQQLIDIGTAVGVGGDSLRAGMAKVEANFTDLYGVRLEVIQSDRTYYVSTTGNDANDGLSVGTPVATILKATQLIHNALWVPRGLYAIVKLADGTYTEAVEIQACHGPGMIKLVGNVSTPANVTVTSAGNTLAVLTPVKLRIESVTLRTTLASRACVASRSGGYVEIGPGVIFGATSNASWHLAAYSKGLIVCLNDYTISGQCEHHYYTEWGGTIQADNLAITLTGTPTISGTFTQARVASVIVCRNTTFTGAFSSASARADSESNSCIDTDGGGLTYFPGNSNPTTANGGVYV